MILLIKYIIPGSDLNTCSAETESRFCETNCWCERNKEWASRYWWLLTFIKNMRWVLYKHYRNGFLWGYCQDGDDHERPAWQFIVVFVQERRYNHFKILWSNGKIKKVVSGGGGVINLWSSFQKVSGFSYKNPNIPALKYGREMDRHTNEKF